MMLFSLAADITTHDGPGPPCGIAPCPKPAVTDPLLRAPIFQVLYNSELRFSYRIYSSLAADITTIHLFEPLVDLVKHPALYVRGTLILGNFFCCVRRWAAVGNDEHTYRHTTCPSLSVDARRCPSLSAIAPRRAARKVKTGNDPTIARTQ